MCCFATVLGRSGTTVPDISLIVFLENNHGKWLSHMLFGQFKRCKDRCTILRVDGLLSEFEGNKVMTNERQVPK